MATAGLLRFLDDLPVPQNDPGSVREKADEILSRPEYREPPDTIWERVSDFVSEQIGRLLSAIGFGGGGVGTLVAWLVLAALIAAVAALVFWAVQAGEWGQNRGQGGEGEPVIVSTEAHRSARDWLNEAQRHEAEGRWSEGLLCRYRALVTELVDQGVIPELAGRTSGEYVRDVRQHAPAVAAPFAAATELFEAAWYGGATTGPDERDRFVGLAVQVLQPESIGAER